MLLGESYYWVHLTGRALREFDHVIGVGGLVGMAIACCFPAS